MKSLKPRTQKLILFFLFFYFLSSIFHIPRALAVEATSSSKSANLPQSLVDKINELKKEIASKAANLKNEVDKKLSNRIVVGVITQVDLESNKISIQSGNDTKVVAINDYTAFQNDLKKTSKVSIKDFSKDDFIVALGDLDDKNILNAKKLIKTTQPKNKVVILAGQVLSTNNPNFNLLTKDNQNLTVETTANTDIFVNTTEAAFSDIKPKIFLITVGEKTSDKIQSSDFIYISKNLTQIKIEKQNATNSATNSTPAASKK